MSDSNKKLRRYVDDLAPSDQRQVVAIQYDVKKDNAPRIIAAGKGSVADKILKLAEDNRVPLFEDPSLADLMSKLSINQNIPLALFPLVAEVLAVVYKLDAMAKKRKAVKSIYGKNKS